MALSSTSTTSAEIQGARLLREIAVDEGSLESFLKEVRATCAPQRGKTGIGELDRMWEAHGGRLAITGRGMALLYRLVNYLVGERGGTVVVIDVDGRFSASHLTCELRHVHVFRTTPRGLKGTLEGVERYMLWGEHESKGREWLGTVVNGGVGGDIMLGWRGWLRVEREETVGFAPGMSAEEALGESEARQEFVNSRGWRAVSDLGEFSWS